MAMGAASQNASSPSRAHAGAPAGYAMALAWATKSSLGSSSPVMLLFGSQSQPPE